MAKNDNFLPPLKDDIGRGKIYENIIETIGHTPLLRLNKFAKENKISSDILLKLEYFNPLSSVKDRIGAGMILGLERAGKINKDTVLVEPTSGNTGIALAFIAAERGIRLILTMPESMSLERRKLLAHLGAELVLTPAEKGMKGALDKADEILKETDGAIYPSQFTNPNNPLVHSQSTAMEIWNDTDGKVDAIIAGIGTGGTLMGCALALKEKKPALKIIAVEPEGSPIISKGQAGPHKIQGIGAGFIPEIVQKDLIDEVITVDNNEAFNTSRQLAQLEGVAGGISTGANVAAALKYANSTDGKDKMIVTIAPSAVDRYLSTPLLKDMS